MRHGCSLSLVILLLATGLAPAQPPAPQPDLTTSPAVTTIEAPAARYRFWASSDYLLWWVKNGPLPVPLVTTSTNPVQNFDTSGALGQPGTVVLFGQHGMDYGNQSGGRVTLGGWLDPEGTIGLEGSGFWFQTGVSRFGFAAPSNATVLAIPFADAQGVERSQLLSATVVGGSPVGSVSIASTTRLWGSELNTVFAFAQGSALSGQFLLGFRYLDLKEDLQLQGSSLYAGGASGQPLTITDNFDTRNRFYGGQIGSRLTYGIGNFSIECKTLLALGATREAVDIDGNRVANITGLPTNFAHGMFAQSSNIGRSDECKFAVVPEVQINFIYNIGRNWRATVGYDYLYWSAVARPGNQIDRVINTGGPLINQIPGPTTLGGRPTPLINQSSFWAQGISAGLEFRY